MSWKNGKKWVYSITYDEGCELLLKHALPLHRQYGIPGHVCLLASQIGVPRNVPGSSYDGMMILSKQQICNLRKEGWGVSCHGLTHAGITDANARREVVEAKAIIEATLDMRVDMFCVPNNNLSYPAALKVAGEAGYNSIMTIYDNINTSDTDPYRLYRCPLHTEYPAPFFSAFDPYKRIHQAMDADGWIIDYCHCPMPGKAIHPWKDCTLEQLAERFSTVCRLGGGDVWLAEPNEVVKYLLSRSKEVK